MACGHIGQVTDMCRSRRRRSRAETKIGRLTDVWPGSICHDPVVVITIRIDSLDPPTGRVSLEGRPEVGFVGWLGLLRALSEMLAPSDQ